MEDKKGQLDIELNNDVAQGTYANLVVISHSSSEFVADFIRIMPGLPKASVKSRIILTPEHAKRLLYALQDNIRKFEQTYGRINLPENGNNNAIFPLDMEPKGQAWLKPFFAFEIEEHDYRDYNHDTPKNEISGAIM